MDQYTYKADEGNGKQVSEWAGKTRWGKWWERGYCRTERRGWIWNDMRASRWLKGWIQMSGLHRSCKLADFAGTFPEVCQYWGLSKPTIHLVHKRHWVDFLQTSRESVWGADFTGLHWLNYPQFIVIQTMQWCCFSKYQLIKQKELIMNV